MLVSQRRKSLLAFLTLLALLCWSSAAFAQISDSGALSQLKSFPSFAQRLQAHNVALTKEGLLHALHEGDFEVRWLAAYELVNVIGKETIPDVVAALSAEKEQLPRVQMADVLAQAGEARGFVELRSIAGDRSLSPGERMTAVDYLLNLKDRSCLPAVIDILQLSSSDPNNISGFVRALATFQSFKDLSPKDSSVLVEAAAQLLLHRELTVKLSAATAMSILGNPAAIPYLENAIAHEADHGVATELEYDLQRLRKKQLPPEPDPDTH